MMGRNKVDINLHNNHVSFYMEVDAYNQHGAKCLGIAEKLLETCPALDSIGFIDVSAGGIQMSGSLKSSPGYYYADVTIKYDWSNFDDCVKEFESIFSNVDQKDAEMFKNFTKEGEKYGWD